MDTCPKIIDAVGSYDPENGVITVMALLNNLGENGYIITDLYDSETYILKDTKENCLHTKIGLSYKIMMKFVGYTNYIDVTVGNCIRDETCDPPSCGKVSITDVLRDKPVYVADYMTPSPVKGIKVISGNGELTFVWNKDTNIFAYYLVLTDPSSNIVDSGCLPNYMNSYTFSNLTNGITYTLHIYNINQSNTPSSETTSAGIPAGDTTMSMGMESISLDLGSKSSMLIGAGIGAVAGVLLYSVIKR